MRAVLIAAYAVIAIAGCLSGWWWVVLGIVALGVGFYVVWLAESRRAAFGVKQVLVLAVLLRVLMLPMPPGLSGDVYRYLWDGAVQVEGENPFREKPERETRWHGTALYPQVSSEMYYSVYPPVSQFCFRLVAMIGNPMDHPLAASYLMKLSCALAELLGLVLLVRSLAPSPRVILYAWNPLVILECWGQVHSESLAIGLLALAWLAWKKAYPVGSCLLVTMAGLVKIYPLLFLPLLVKRGLPVRTVLAMMLVSISATILLWLPFWSVEAWEHFCQSIDLYVRSFEFNAGPYYALKTVYGLGVGQVLRYCALAASIVLWVICFQTRRDWLVGAAWIMVIHIFFATTLHPWYFLLPTYLAVASGRQMMWIWWWLCGSSILTYVQYPFPNAYWPLVIGIWLVALVLFVVEWGLHRSRTAR